MPAPETAEIAVHEYVRDEHDDTVSAVVQCADRVAESWPDEATTGEPTATDRHAVVEPLSRELRESGVLAAFPPMLAGAVSAAGFSMQASPVPAPPYVALTSRGPVLRATVSGGRLVVLFRVFDVVRDGRTRYVRGASDPQAVITVSLE